MMMHDNDNNDNDDKNDYDEKVETFHNRQGVQQVGYATEGRTARKSPLDKLSSGGGT